jgi:alcohol dehydrogenase (cytochrome c)
VWETPVLEATKRASRSRYRSIANGKIFTGRQCQPDASNESCVITAHDAKTGKEVWRTRTIPRRASRATRRGERAARAAWHVGTWMVPELRSRAQS